MHFIVFGHSLYSRSNWDAEPVSTEPARGWQTLSFPVSLMVRVATLPRPSQADTQTLSQELVTEGQNGGCALTVEAGSCNSSHSPGG